jgi:2,5-dihydroxypyridine 5,6-dioxygenase
VHADTGLVKLFVAELELCGVRPDETIAILSDQERRATTHLGDYAQAFDVAVQELGARVFEIVVPARSNGAGRSQYGRAAHGSAVGRTPLTGMQAALDALKTCDMVIDLMMLLHSAEQLEILAAGTRMLLVQEPPDVLSRMFPTAGLRRSVEEAAAKLAAGRELRVTSPAGTDVTYQLGQYDRLTIEYGYVDEPGRWDHFTAGLVAAYGNDNGVNGTVVLDRGDVLFPFKRYVDTPIELTISNEYITAIDGGLDAFLLREYLESWDDPEAFAVSHIGWGLSDTAIWSSLAMMDPRSVVGMEQRSAAGCVMFSTGPNVDGGGSRHTAAHCDMPMLGCSLFLDGAPVVVDGKLVQP